MAQTKRFFSLNTLGIYAFVWILGNILGPCFWMLVLLGAIRIRRYRNAIQAVKDGNLIIAANHPSLLETFLIPVMFYPRFLFNLRYLVWSMPDRNLFPPFLRWVYPCIRCITVDRAKRIKSALGAVDAIEILRQGGTVVVHPEGGRTIRGTAFVTFGDRKIRPIMSSVPKMARESNAKILPLWIDMPNVDRPLGLGRSIARLFLSKYRPIVMSFGEETYHVRCPLDLRAENVRLQEKILSS